MQIRIFRQPLRAVIRLLLVPGLLLSFNHRAAALSILDTGSFSGHNYYLLGSSTWTDAETAAIQLGGHLATVNDAAENNWIWSTWGSGRNLWTGLNDAAVEGTFVWANGEPVTYTNWRSGEPNNGGLPGGNEDYSHIMGAGQSESPGQWNDYQNLMDVPGGPSLFGVVEVVPEPAIGTLLALGPIACLIRRRFSRS